LSTLQTHKVSIVQRHVTSVVESALCAPHVSTFISFMDFPPPYDYSPELSLIWNAVSLLFL